MNSIVLERIASAAASLGPHYHLDDDGFEVELSSTMARRENMLRYPATVHGIADEGPVEVKRWLLGLPVDAKEQVVVLWPALRSGIVVGYRGLVAAYDDLWLPGSDDVLVHPCRGGWLLEFDHEEVVRFWKE